MKKQIYHHHWQRLSVEDTYGFILFVFGNQTQAAHDGTQVTCSPPIKTIKHLRLLNSATLELLENREHSTVYRIKQTNLVIQVKQDACIEFDGYDDYHLNANTSNDKLLTQYEVDKLKFTAKFDSHGQLFIYHHEHPPFKARYIGGNLSNFDSFEPDDVFNKLESDAATKLLQKANAFLMSYFIT